MLHLTRSSRTPDKRNYLKLKTNTRGLAYYLFRVIKEVSAVTCLQKFLGNFRIIIRLAFNYVLGGREERKTDKLLFHCVKSEPTHSFNLDTLGIPRSVNKS